MVAFMRQILTEIKSTPAVQPIGTSASQDVFTRNLADVRFERKTPAQTAEATISEVNGMVQK